MDTKVNVDNDVKDINDLASSKSPSDKISATEEPVDKDNEQLEE